jgi:hypothetical protein
MPAMFNNVSAYDRLNYKQKKIGFIVLNGKYVIVRQHFNRFWGHQNAQFNTPLLNQSKTAVIQQFSDGVLYIKGKNKMYKEITEAG